MAKSFNEMVWQKLKKIPRGKVATYKQIAIALGKPNSARAVGNSCNRNPNTPMVPCHRVVKSDGAIGGYNKGKSRKIALLLREGVAVKGGKIVGFEGKIFRFK